MNDAQHIDDTSSAIKSPTEKLPSINKIKNIVADMVITDDTPEACCERAGLTLERVYNRLAGLIDAKMVLRSGGAEYEVPDNKTRMVAVQLVLELRRHIKDKSVVTQVGIFNDPKVVAEAERVLRLRDGLAERYSGGRSNSPDGATRTNGGEQPPLNEGGGEA